MLKKALRKQYKDLRSQFTEEEVEEKSLAISNQLLNLTIWDKSYYHLFLPIINQKEVNTEMILHVLFAKNKEVVISKSDFNKMKLTHFLLTENTKLKENKYGIPEPENGLPVPENYIDVVFVPLLAFDKKGNRVGYGKGFYDRFLEQCKPETLKIGLSFFEAEISITDIDEEDIPLDYCVTPNKIYHFE